MKAYIKTALRRRLCLDYSYDGTRLEPSVFIKSIRIQATLAKQQ